jgi:hypothetical protein
VVVVVLKKGSSNSHHDTSQLGWGSPWLKNLERPPNFGRRTNGSGEVDSGRLSSPPPPLLRETYPERKRPTRKILRDELKLLEKKIGT